MKKLVLLIGLAGMFLFSCDLFFSYPKIEFDKAAFERERTKWENQNITNYTFDARDFPGFPNHQFRITVTGGNITGFENLVDAPGEICSFCGNGRICDQPPEIDKRWATISGLYAWIVEQHESYIERIPELRKKEYFSISIRYNDQYHYPEHISTERNFYDNPMVGGWVAFDITNFQIKP